jgi:hypothetical protein
MPSLQILGVPRLQCMCSFHCRRNILINKRRYFFNYCETKKSIFRILFILALPLQNLSVIFSIYLLPFLIHTVLFPLILSHNPKPPIYLGLWSSPNAVPFNWFGSCQISAGNCFIPWRWRQNIISKRWYLEVKVHRLAFQKTVNFNFICMMASNFTYFFSFKSEIDLFFCLYGLFDLLFHCQEHNTVVPPYLLIQYPRYTASQKEKLKIKEINSL